MKKSIFIIIPTLLLIALDQISKYFFYDQNLLNNLDIIQPVFNTGISRSLPVPYLLTIFITVLILWYLIRLYNKNKISKRVVIFVIAGAIWNLIDRIYLWWVKDFILAFDRFPIFNLADIFINIWIIILLIKELFWKWNKTNKNTTWKNKIY
jgi:signal peptidase II